MLREVFTKIIELSLVGCYSVLVVLAVRALLSRFERRFSYYLWFIVFLNLCIPWSIQGVFSLIPRQVAEFSLADLPGEEIGETAGVNGGIAGTRDAAGAEGLLTGGRQGGPADGGNVGILPTAGGTGESPFWELEGDQLAAKYQETLRREQGGKTWTLLDGAAALWLLGAGLVLGGNLFQYFRLRQRIRRGKVLAWDPEKRIRTVDSIQSAFLYGLIRPCIYLPAGLAEEEKFYIIAHEQYHRKRKDYLVKPAALCIAALHWFNPLVWLALVLFFQDMEVSCDEKVLDHTTGQVRKQYAASLLKFAAQQNGFMVTSLNFGKPALESRIKNVLKEKRRSVFITAISGAVILALAVGLLLRPQAGSVGKPGEGDVQGAAGSEEGDPQGAAGLGSQGGSPQDLRGTAGSDSDDGSSQDLQGAVGSGSEGTSGKETEGIEGENALAGVPYGEDPEGEAGGRTQEELEFWEMAVIGSPCDPAEAGWDLASVTDVREGFSQLPFEPSPEQEGLTYLLKETESYRLYGKGDYESMLLEKEGHYSLISCGYMSNYAIPPAVWESDYDNDGAQELSIILNLLHGTGVYVDTFLMADTDENGELFVYQYLDTDYLEALRAHLSFEQAEGGTQALVDGVQAGVPLASEETGEGFDSVDVGDVIHFSATDRRIGLNAPVAFYKEDWAIAQYNGSSVYADVIYRDGGKFSLEALWAFNDDLTLWAENAAAAYYREGYQAENGAFLAYEGEKDPDAIVLETRFWSVTPKRVLAVCQVRAGGRDDHWLNVCLENQENLCVADIGTWQVTALWETPGEEYPLSARADAFLQDLCMTLPDFAYGTSLDESFWHDFLFASYTDAWTAAGREVIQMYREDLGFAEDQVKVSGKEAGERVRLALGAELPDTYQPSPEEMPERSTGFYYQDGFYYIGTSDNPEEEYTLAESRIFREASPFSTQADQGAYYQEIWVKYLVTSAGENLGYMNFLLIPAENENGFVVKEKYFAAL